MRYGATDELGYEAVERILPHLLNPVNKLVLFGQGPRSYLFVSHASPSFWTSEKNFSASGRQKKKPVCTGNVPGGSGRVLIPVKDVLAPLSASAGHGWSTASTS